MEPVQILPYARNSPQEWETWIWAYRDPIIPQATIL